MPKISLLPTGTTLSGLELVPVVQAGQTIRTTVGDFLGNSSVQVVTASSGIISTTTSTLLINRATPTTTAITLPNAASTNGRQLRVIDYSTSVTEHTITLTPATAVQKVMRQSTWLLVSNDVSLASITLWPIVDPDDATNYVWVIAP